MMPINLLEKKKIEERNKAKIAYNNYENIERMLIAEASSYSLMFIKDAHLRVKYDLNVERAVKDIRVKLLLKAENYEEFLDLYHRGKGGVAFYGKSAASIIESASREASAARNAIMESIRMQTSPTMRAWAKSLKQDGKKFNDLLDAKAKESFPASNGFAGLKNDSQRASIYFKVLNSAASPNKYVNILSEGVSYSCKGLLIATYAIAAYNIYKSDDKVSETIHQGSIIAGAEAGLTVSGNAALEGCLVVAPTGLGYFACVGATAFVGSVVGAFAGGAAYEWLVQK